MFTAIFRHYSHSYVTAGLMHIDFFEDLFIVDYYVDEPLQASLSILVAFPIFLYFFLIFLLHHTNSQPLGSSYGVVFSF